MKKAKNIKLTLSLADRTAIESAVRKYRATHRSLTKDTQELEKKMGLSHYRGTKKDVVIHLDGSDCSLLHGAIGSYSSLLDLQGARDMELVEERIYRQWYEQDDLPKTWQTPDSFEKSNKASWEVRSKDLK